MRTLGLGGMRDTGVGGKVSGGSSEIGSKAPASSYLRCAYSMSRMQVSSRGAIERCVETCSRFLFVPATYIYISGS